MSEVERFYVALVRAARGLYYEVDRRMCKVCIYGHKERCSKPDCPCICREIFGE